MKVVVHANPSIPWHVKRGNYFAEGLRRIGHSVEISSDRFRHDGLPILLGTNFWKSIERDGCEYLLVDRCSFGDTEKFVQLVRNGHGRRGDHRVPENFDASRWEKHGVEIRDWQIGKRRVLCGQIEPFSPDWPDLEVWYASMRASHFRKHPAGLNFTSLPSAATFEDCGLAITLNSSVGVQCILNGIPTQTWDEGAMAWDVAGPLIDTNHRPDRLPWCHYLAWTQWSDQEIREGVPWAYLL